MNENILEIIDLSLGFNGSGILHNLNLTLGKGELISVVGPSGCGKSSLLKCISGLYEGYQGEVRYYGDKLGYMPQDNLLLNHRTIKRNITLPRELKSNQTLSEKDEKELEELYVLFGLKAHLSKYPREISGGMKSRVALLRTYLMSKELFLLDEPFASLDMITRRELQKFLMELVRDYKISVVYITHDIREATDMSDKVFLIDSGGEASEYIVKEHPKEELFNLLLKKLEG